MSQPDAIWFMEGVSSQKDILALVAQARRAGRHDFLLIASHRSSRPEILAEADIAYLEPEDDGALFAFIRHVCQQHRVRAIHAGKRGALLEQQRTAIEALGVRLVTGARERATFTLADNKTRFSAEMSAHGLPAVPSIEVRTPDEVAAAIAQVEAQGHRPCIKPVHGIYGMGFWVLRRDAHTLSFFNNPDSRQIHPDVLIESLRRAQQAGESLPLQIVMPWLAGPERSVDMLVENGRVIAAVARRKEGSVQVFEQETPAWRLAVACAETLHVDGLINVQTRNDAEGHPVLLEANLRPSGGIGYTAFSGINLPGLFALRQLELISAADAIAQRAAFNPVQVIPTNAVQPLPQCDPVTWSASPDEECR